MLSKKIAPASFSPLDKEFSARISLIRYPMIFLIVVSHVPQLGSFADDPTVMTFISTFITNALIRLGIPMLSCISGFLIFYRAMDLNFPVLLQKRFNSLVSPLLIWNIPIVLMLYFVQSQGLVDYDFAARKTMYPMEAMTWANAVFSLTDFPINFPMHFLRDLFVVTLFVPLMSMMLRKFPIAGLIVLMAVFIPNLDGLLLRNDTIIITFYLGGMAATMKWNLKFLDGYVLPLGCLLLLIGILVVVLDLGRPIWLPLLAPFIVWPVASIFVGTRLGRLLGSLSRSSIFLFMFHGLVIMAITAVFPYLRDGNYSYYIWLAMPIVVATIGQITYLLLDNVFPQLLTLLMGDRKATAPQ